MAKSNMDQDILKVLLSEEEIKARVCLLYTSPSPRD